MKINNLRAHFDRDETTSNGNYSKSPHHNTVMMTMLVDV